MAQERGVFVLNPSFSYTAAMRIYLESLGCRLNYAEMAALGRRLAGAGHELAASAEDADLCVVNSCAVTGEAARQSRQLARRLARTNPAARLVVTGCYASLEGATVASLPNVALVVGNAAKDDLLTLIQSQVEGEKFKVEGNGDSGQHDPQPAGHTPEPSTLHLQSATGAFHVGGAMSLRAESCTVFAGRSEAIPCIEGDCFVANDAPRNDCPKTETHSPATTHQPPSTLNLQPSRTRAFVKVQDGCRNHCTFCIVTVARGDERSRPIAEVVAEVSALHAEGYQEAVLTGVHLGGYGSDLDTGLSDLIAALLVGTTIPRLRVSSLEPFDLRPDFFELWAGSGGRLMPHLHLPAQSGSDAVLRRMGRRNNTAEFERLVETARARIPGLTITTDLIAGFPGETDEDFAQTMASARRMGFAHMHIFPYSARAGTAAARLAGQVPDAERKRRVRALSELDVALGEAVRTSFVGQARPVLWENRTAPAVWSGLTDNYLRVQAELPPGLEWHNRITLTRLTGLAGDDLWGSITQDCR